MPSDAARRLKLDCAVALACRRRLRGGLTGIVPSGFLHVGWRFGGLSSTNMVGSTNVLCKAQVIDTGCPKGCSSQLEVSQGLCDGISWSEVSNATGQNFCPTGSKSLRTWRSPFWLFVVGNVTWALSSFVDWVNLFFSPTQRASRASHRLVRSWAHTLLHPTCPSSLRKDSYWRSVCRRSATLLATYLRLRSLG